jgi:hypothetical protein
MRVYYTNEGFVDHATGRHQVAMIDENEPGYTVYSTWPNYEEAQQCVRALNAQHGIDYATMNRVVASSINAQYASDGVEVRRRVTDLEHDYPLSSLAAILSTPHVPVIVPETSSPAAEFLTLVRDAFVRVIGEHLEDGDDLHTACEHATDESDDVLMDCVTPMVSTRWEIFVALKAWNEDIDDRDGLGLDLTELAAYALVERGRRIWATLIETLDGQSDD